MSDLVLCSSPAVAQALELVSHGDRLPQGTFSVHSRFGRCVNFSLGEALVSLVDESIGAGPFHLVVRPFSGLAQTIEIASEHVDIDGLRLPRDPATRYVSQLHLDGSVTPQALDAERAAFESLLHTLAPCRSLGFLLEETAHAVSTFERVFRDRMREAVDLLRDERPTEASALVRGAGFGLTPSGDDFLCGLLIASHLCERALRSDLSAERNALYEASTGDNPLSNAFLRDARTGCLNEPVKRVAEALWTGKHLEPATRVLLAQGETSGADTAVGIALGIQYWLGVLA